MEVDLSKILVDTNSTDEVAATNPSPFRLPVQKRSESGEHSLLGDSIFLTFDPSIGKISAKNRGLWLNPFSSSSAKQISYTFGQYLALGGDFYGDPAWPISDADDPIYQFGKNWVSLVNAAERTAETNDILSIMKEEIDGLQKAIAAPSEQRSDAIAKFYDEEGDSLSVKWAKATNYRYYWLASNNWDHFGKGALKSYMAGHHNAIQSALNARNSQNKDYARKLLEEAYARDAFACHFLTDIFSAGHMRTPRKELHAYSTATVAGFAYGALAGDFLARAMHDEDSENGLHVVNKQKDSWIAYGDKKLYATENAENSDLCVKALQASVDEVWAAFCSEPRGPFQAPFAALDLVPDLDAIAKTTRNSSPLFKVESGTLLLRADFSDRYSTEYVSKFDPVVTLSKLKLSKAFAQLDIWKYFPFAG